MNEYGIRVLGICDDDLQKELNKNNKNKAVFLHCQCHCGKEFDTRQQNIKKIKSCGCSRNKLKQKGKQAIGEKYGRLTIIGVDEERTAAKNKDGKHGGLFVMCKCECGELKVNTFEMNRRIYNPEFKCCTLTCINGGYQEKKVLDHGAPRKLTAIEYERLQGLPDNYTNIKMGSRSLSYSKRCSLMGNGWTEPVVEWILSGIRKDINV